MGGGFDAEFDAGEECGWGVGLWEEVEVEGCEGWGGERGEG